LLSRNFIYGDLQLFLSRKNFQGGDNRWLKKERVRACPDHPKHCDEILINSSETIEFNAMEAP
jgi:hypothetical protein